MYNESLVSVVDCHQKYSTILKAYQRNVSCYQFTHLRVYYNKPESAYLSMRKSLSINTFEPVFTS